MQDNDRLQEKGERPILDLIQKIRDELVDPRLLSMDERRQCVEILLCEGMNEATIAQILKRSEKTIYRDVLEIRKRNAIVPSIEMVKEMAGELLTNARIHHAYLMRIARSKDSSTPDKIQAELAAWNVLDGLVERMQSLGYLPLRPQEIIGDLFHHIDEQNAEKAFQDVRKTLSDVIDVAQQCGTLTPELQEGVNSLRQRVEKAEIIEQTAKLSKQPNEIKEENHDK